MRAQTWRYLLLGGVALGLTMVTACSSEEDPADDDGVSGSGTTGGAGASAAGSAGKGTAGSTGGAGASSAGTAGTVSGSSGTSPGGSGGSTAGTAGAGGTSAGASGAGAGAGGVAGTASPDGGTTAVGGSAGDNVGGGGATAGTGGGGMAATLVDPIDRGSGTYVLEFSDGLFFKVSSMGARVLDVHIGSGANLLTGSDINDTNYGSTFWTAPQSDWSWPPVTEIDSAAYTATVASPSVSFAGTASSTLGVKVNKKFTADLAKGTIVVEYTMVATAAGKSYAPWEITRFFKRGLTFYPTGSTPTEQPGNSFPGGIVPTTASAGCTWYDATANPTTMDQKMIADGTGGWLAHVDGQYLVVKKFQDIQASAAAENENEIAIYASGSANYIEVEQQGAYGPVAMDTGTTWTVTWYVRQLPAEITPTVGNQMLVDYVTSLVQ